MSTPYDAEWLEYDDDTRPPRDRSAAGAPTTEPDGVKRGGRHAIIDAAEEEKMRAIGMPVRCCDYWPECSHVLAWVEEYDARAEAGT